MLYPSISQGLFSKYFTHHRFKKQKSGYTDGYENSDYHTGALWIDPLSG